MYYWVSQVINTNVTTLAACRESAGSYNKLPEVLYVF